MPNAQQSPTSYVLQIMQQISTTTIKSAEQAQKQLHEWLTNLNKVQPHIQWDLRLIPFPDNPSDTTTDLVIFDGTSIRTLVLDNTQLDSLTIDIAQFLLQLHYKDTLTTSHDRRVQRIERLVATGALRTGGHINKDLIDMCHETLASA